jgi:hypothetical protein
VNEIITLSASPANDGCLQLLALNPDGLSAMEAVASFGEMD